MPEEERKTDEIKTQEPPEAIKQILRGFRQGGGVSMDMKFAYTLNIPGVCMVSFVCNENNAENFIEKARNEAMFMINAQAKVSQGHDEPDTDENGIESRMFG